jgi:hypothetical protein
MSKSKVSASPSHTSDTISPLLAALVDIVVKHTTLDQCAVENLRRALASSGQA